MVAIKAHEADRVLSNPDRGIAVYLFYGPDQGLVGERCEKMATSSVADPSDPFQLVRLDGGVIAADPLRLIDEANTMGLFGARRAIWVTAGPRFPAAAIEPILGNPPPDTTIVLEAADLAKNNPLRLAVERAKRALAVPCYNDGALSLETVVDAVLHEHGATITRDARTVLLARLGVDRRVSRREIEKLATYAGPGQCIDVADVDAIVGDASARAVDDVADGVFAGNVLTVDEAFQRLYKAGEDAGVLLGFVTRHAQALLVARHEIDANGKSPTDAAAGMRGISFPRRKVIELALARWSAPQLAKAVIGLHSAIAQVRLNPALANELATRVLWNLARSGGRG
jgi:DNA polymerase III subunit delta